MAQKRLAHSATKSLRKDGEFKQQLVAGKTLDDILPEAFAVFREATFRVLGEKRMVRDPSYTKRNTLHGALRRADHRRDSASSG